MNQNSPISPFQLMLYGDGLRELRMKALAKSRRENIGNRTCQRYNYSFLYNRGKYLSSINDKLHDSKRIRTKRNKGTRLYQRKTANLGRGGGSIDYF